MRTNPARITTLPAPKQTPGTAKQTPGGAGVGTDETPVDADLVIVLPLPPKECSPNDKSATYGGRMKKARITKAYRNQCGWAATAALQKLGRTPPKAETATCQLHFFYKTAQRVDSDNALASAKALSDGALTDASIVADDAGVTWLPVVMDKDKNNPRVVLSVWLTGEKL